MNKLKTLTLALLTLSLIACNGEQIDLDSSESNPQQISLRKKFQRTKRYDCEGKLATDEIETVQSATKVITVAPPTYNDLNSSRFYNHTTHDQNGTTFSLDTFTINYSPDIFMMEVDAGLNKIEYTFTYCHEDDEGVCTDDEREVNGFVYIEINYNEITLDGFREIYASEAECNPEEEDEETNNN